MAGFERPFQRYVVHPMSNGSRTVAALCRYVHALASTGRSKCPLYTEIGEPTYSEIFYDSEGKSKGCGCVHMLLSTPCLR